MQKKQIIQIIFFLVIGTYVVIYNYQYFSKKKSKPPFPVQQVKRRSPKKRVPKKAVKKKVVIKKRTALKGLLKKSPFYTFEELEEARRRKLKAIQKKRKPATTKKVLAKKKKKPKKLVLIPVENQVGNEKDFEHLRVTSILISPTGNIAIVNNQVLTEGDTIDDIDIARVMDTSVLFRKGNRTKKIFLRQSTVPLEVLSD